ncbi:MFS transporter [Alkalicoccus urumqiensis]|uniref:MFS transporter n=2 Tax=Alkalicoccus urumqiensis TaxID=1548213 RepID=A0A2P6ML23_ALKUR|nr:MFS transporter [Alkalicoccus urumqiensis]
MWTANFFVAASATMVLPFLAVYIETFGAYSDAYVQRWAGFIFGITFLVAFIAAPLWGRFGDRFGRKKILLITGYGIAVSIFLMSFVNSVWELFFLRAFMGLVTGFIPTSMALISAQTNKEEAGKVLGTLQMGTVSGSLFGPLLGGILADSVGFTYTFVLTAIGITLATTAVAFGIHEIRSKSGPQEKASAATVYKTIFTNRMLLFVMLLSFAVQAANFSIQPQLALFVDQLVSVENAAFLAGAAFSMTGLGNLIATRFWGIQGDRYGHEWIVLICMALCALFLIPQAFSGSLTVLLLLRFLFGLALGGVIPCVTAYIRRAVPLDMQGEVLGYNQSFRFLGNVAGPAAGGVAAGLFGLASVFILSGAVLAAGAALYALVIMKEKKGARNHAVNEG